MAAQFCMGCGSPLPPNAKFCASCGTPMASSPMPTGPGSAPTPPVASIAPPAPVAPPAPSAPAAAPAPPAPMEGPAPFPSPPLGEVLGLAGRRKFLLQHLLLSGARNYRVLDHEKHHLFTVKESIQQELQSNFLGGQPGQGMSLQFGTVAPRTHTDAWVVEDPHGGIRGSIRIQFTGNEAISTLSGENGVAVLAVRIDRGMMGGLKAYVGAPNGQGMLETQGNLLRHSFAIKDPSGREVAKIHEAFVSIRDTYNLDLLEDIDPLAPLILAIMIDREKEANSEAQPNTGGFRMGNPGHEVRL